MKAILVLELDDEWYNRITTTCGEMLADVVLYKKESLEEQCDYSQRVYRCWCPLKSIPERKEVRKVKYINDVVFKQTTYDYIANEIHGQIIYDVDRIFAEGYNACLDEILGEEQ